MNKDNKYITKQCTLNILQQYIYYNNTFITTIQPHEAKIYNNDNNPA